jgi:hypothetical protein
VDARAWLAACGVRQAAGGDWVDATEPDRPLTANDVAHAWAGAVFADEDLDRAGQLTVAFGLLDLLDDYWVTCEISFADRGPAGPRSCGPATAAGWRRNATPNR